MRSSWHTGKCTHLFFGSDHKNKKLHQKKRDWKEHGDSGATQTWFLILTLSISSCVTWISVSLSEKWGWEAILRHPLLVVGLLTSFPKFCQFHLPEVSWLSLLLSTFLVQVISLLVDCHSLLPRFTIPFWLLLQSMCYTASELSFKTVSNHTVKSSLCLFWSLPFFLAHLPLPLLPGSNRTGLLSLPQTPDACPHPRAFALVLTPAAWCALLSNVCLATFLSFWFQVKCLFYKWSYFLRSFLPC